MLGEVEGCLLGDVEGDVEGEVEGCLLGLLLGLSDGEVVAVVCCLLGDVEGEVEGCMLGLLLGPIEGGALGDMLGEVEGCLLGDVEVEVGCNFSMRYPDASYISSSVRNRFQTTNSAIAKSDFNSEPLDHESAPWTPPLINNPTLPAPPGKVCLSTPFTSLSFDPTSVSSALVPHMTTQFVTGSTELVSSVFQPL